MWKLRKDEGILRDKNLNAIGRTRLYGITLMEARTK